MGETRRRGVADSVPHRAVRVPGEQQQGLCGVGGTYRPTARGSAPVHVVVDQRDDMLAVGEPPESLYLEVGFTQLLDALAQQVLHCIEPAAAAAVFCQVYCAEASLGDLLQDEHLLVSHLGSGIHLHGPLADKCNMLVWEVSRTDLDKVDAKLNRAFFATLAASVIETSNKSALRDSVADMADFVLENPMSIRKFIVRFFNEATIFIFLVNCRNLKVLSVQDSIKALQAGPAS